MEAQPHLAVALCKLAEVVSRLWGVSRQRKERNAGHIEAPLPEGTRPNTTGRVRSNSETRVVVRMGPKQSKQLPSAGKSAGFGPRRFPGEDADRLGGAPDQGGGRRTPAAGWRPALVTRQDSFVLQEWMPTSKWELRKPRGWLWPLWRSRMSSRAAVWMQKVWQ